MKIRRPGAHSREAGYNLVVLMVAITVLNIMIAATLPLWSRIIQHDKEEELIFRGLQYAEAIRLFRARFQRAPVRLEELLEAKPRCIRQLWKDPMSEDGKWKILYEGVQQPPGTVQPQAPGSGGGKGDPEEGSEKNPGGDEGADRGDGEGDQGSGFLTTEKKEELTIGPIEGVTSKSKKPSAMVWFGQQRYDQWQFRWQLLAQRSFGVPGQQGLEGGGQPVPQGDSVRWLGRPWPKWLGLQSAPPIPQPGLPGQPGVPGGLTPPNNRPGGGDGGAFGVPQGLPPDPEDSPPSEG